MQIARTWRAISLDLSTGYDSRWIVRIDDQLWSNCKLQPIDVDCREFNDGVRSICVEHFPEPIPRLPCGDRRKFWMLHANFVVVHDFHSLRARNAMMRSLRWFSAKRMMYGKSASRCLVHTSIVIPLCKIRVLRNAGSQFPHRLQR